MGRWLLGDIGGTNARFALAGEGGIGPTAALKVEDYPDPQMAIRRFLAETERPPERAALAIAGPVGDDGTAALTNGPWRFDAGQLGDDLGIASVSLLNDFQAVAWALPRLAVDDLLKIGGGKAQAGKPLAVLGPGTGLGVAGYLPALDAPLGQPWGESRPRVLVTEGGHVTLAAATQREADIIALLRERFGHVSAERAICGVGLVNLHGVIAELEGQTVPERSAAEILEAAATGCPISAAAFETFCDLLGTVAADLALSLGAEGGVYLAGGILPRVSERFAASGFRRRFEDKGRFSGYLAAIPTWLITRPNPAFLGLWSLLQEG